ncbi:hypothetical protein TNCT_17761 [Trichonephila clavata]|uniref:Uncharacterized protein n=1 Tax=Trichonephila clavata TaxID=2740835 RepID=A0A8X6LG23_TRICU|nr:hypothetical protein TNCT_17761 [Trichonephila clavata]
MLSNLDYNTKMTALQNPTTLDQQFFDWVRNGVQQLRNDLDAARTQLVLAIEYPSNYEVTEVVENLPALCGFDTDSELKQERDQLKVERDQLKEENDHLKTERNQLKDEKGQLMIENGLLKENRDIFWRETEILRNEKDVLKAERDQFLKESDRLKKKTNILKVEGDEWKQRCTELEHELKQEKFRLAEHCNVLQEELELFHKECKKLVDPFKIQTFVMDVRKKYGLTQDIYKNFIEFLNHFNMTLTTHNWPQEIISKFKQLECLKGKYETLLVDHDEMQNNYEKDLERIVETNNTQQNHLKQQLRECEAELQDCRDKLLEPKSETLVEGGSCTPIKNKKFKRRSIAHAENNDEDWKTNILNWKTIISVNTYVSLVQMKCLLWHFSIVFQINVQFQMEKIP